MDTFGTPPDILLYLARRLVVPINPFPTLASDMSELGRPQALLRLLQVCAVYDRLSIAGDSDRTTMPAELLVSRASSTISYMVEQHLGHDWLSDLPYAIAIPILEMLRVCQSNPDRSWSREILCFIGRTDLAIQRQDIAPSAAHKFDLVSQSVETRLIKDRCRAPLCWRPARTR